MYSLSQLGKRRQYRAPSLYRPRISTRSAGAAEEAGRRPGPEGMPKSNDGDQRRAEANTPDAAAGTHDPRARTQFHSGARSW